MKNLSIRKKIIISLLSITVLFCLMMLILNTTQTAYASDTTINMGYDYVETDFGTVVKTGTGTSVSDNRSTLKARVNGSGNYTNESSHTTLYKNTGSLELTLNYTGGTCYHYFYVFSSCPSAWSNRTRWGENEDVWKNATGYVVKWESNITKTTTNGSVTDSNYVWTWNFNNLPDGTYYVYSHHRLYYFLKGYEQFDSWSSFTINTSTPDISCYTESGKSLSNGAITNESIRFNWADGNSNYGKSSATINGSAYTKNSYITTEKYEGNKLSSHNLVLTAPSGNTKSFSVTIDKTAPTGMLLGVSNGGITKENVTFSWTESGCRATDNGSAYTNGTTISAEGNHTIVLTDTANNKTTYTFEIDKTAPTGTLSGVSNGGFTNTNVSFAWNDRASATLNGSPYTSGSVISAERSHTIVLTDTANNKTTYTFEIDKTAPTARLIANNQYLDNGSFTNKNVTISWSESYITCTNKSANLALFDELNNSTITDEGLFSFVLTDRAGNAITYMFTIDKTAPTGTLAGVSDKGYTNGQVSFAWSEDNCTATLNGEPYNQNDLISAEGKYNIVLTDIANNSTTYTFEIDKTAPTGTLSGVSNGGITNKNVNLSWTDIKNSATLNGEPYTSESVISAERTHTLILSDKAGNSTTYTFEIDKTAPTGTLTNVVNGGKTNQPVTFIWTEANCAISLNGNSLSYDFDGVDYISEEITTDLNTRTSYALILSDVAGNKTEYTFIIDRRIPTGKIVTATGEELLSGAETNKNIRFNVNNTNNIVTVNGEPYTSGSLLKGVDDTILEYVFLVRDELGNENSYSVLVNKLKPKIEFINNTTKLNVQPGQTFYFNKDIILNFSQTCTVKVNDSVVSSGYKLIAPVNAETSYEITITNDADNTNKYSIVLDTVPYTANYNYFLNNYKNHINKWWETYAYTLTNGSYVRGQTYSFSSYEDTLTYAQQRELDMAEFHDAYLGGTIYCDYSGTAVAGTDVTNTTSMLNQPYYIYKDINSANKLIAYFNTSNLYNAINYYANSSIQQKNIPSTPAPEFQGNDFIGKQQVITDYIYVKGTQISLPTSSSLNTLIVNGNVVDYSYKLVSGVNSIKEIDRAGNETVYYIMLDTDLPVAQATDFANNIISDLTTQLNNTSVSTVYYNKQFRLYVNDMIDPNALLSVTVNGLTTLIFGQDTNNFYDFNTSGTYTLAWRDIAGNVREVTLILILETPEINVTEILDGNNTLSSFKIEVTTNTSNQLWSITVYMFNDESGTWIAQNQDANGLLISKDTFIYNFASNGKYKIEVIDRFGESITTEYTFIKNAPTGTLYNDDDIALQNGSRVNAQVRFTWTDVYASATLNGEPYTKDVYIVAQGDYVIILTDRSGNSSTYTFTIDKTAPVFDLVGVELSGTTNSNVTISWDIEKEKGTTAQIKIGNGKYNIYQNGAEITEENSYTIILTDVAGNTTTISFKIDKTPPDIIITSSLGKVYTNMSVINTSIKITWQGTATTYVNGALYQKDTLISAEGSYNISLIDAYGNATSARIKIDKTAPTGILTGIQDNGFALGEVIFAWSEDNCIATLNGEPYTSGTAITTDGEYTLILSDVAGNKTTYNFTIDTIAPTGIFSDTAGNKFENNFYTNKSIRFSWTVSASATLTGEPYTSGTAITTDGEYTLILTDKAGNFTTYTFTIDRTAPTGTLTGVSDKGYTNQPVTLTWEENDTTATLNGLPYSSGSIIDNATGTAFEYKIVLTDKAGNVTTYTFTIDKTAPTGTFRDSLGTAIKATPFIINKTVRFAWTEANCTATLNGEPYTSGSVISADAEYTLTLTDRAGNATTYTFTIDRSIPSFNVLTENNANIDFSKTYFNQSIKFDWTEDSTTATLNGALYQKDTLISAEGSHTLILTSQAGNSITYTFTIDKTAPTGILENVENNGCTNKNVNFSWTESGCTATLNDEPYSSKTLIKNDGIYTLILTDKAGNVTTYTFTIYTKPVNYTIEGVNSDNYSNSEFYVIFDSNYHTATLNGDKYIVGSTISAEGEYNFIITNLSGVSETVRIVVDKTAPIISFVSRENTDITDMIISYPFMIKRISSDIKEIIVNDVADTGTFYSENNLYLVKVTDFAGNISIFNITLDGDAPLGFFNVDFIDGITNKNVIFSWFEESCTATLNGEPYTSGTEITDEGEYALILTDALGNYSTYTFIIDRTAPTATFYNRNGNEITNGSMICVDVRLDFSYLYKATLNGEPYTSGTYLKGIEDASTLYNIYLTDKYGNQKIFAVVINRKAPVILETYETDFISNETKTFTWEDINTTATLNGEPYTSGTEITDEGEYTLILTSQAGKTKTYTFTIDKTAPTCEMKNLQDNGYVITYTQAYWEDFSATATLNGEPYTKNTAINKDGEYTLILTDKAGNVTTCTFIVDRAEVEAKVLFGEEEQELKNKTYYNPIKLTSNGTITINGEPYTSGTELGAGTYQAVITLVSGRTATFDFTVKIQTVVEQNAPNILINVIAIMLASVTLVLLIIKIRKTAKSSKRKII